MTVMCPHCLRTSDSMCQVLKSGTLLKCGKCKEQFRVDLVRFERRPRPPKPSREAMAAVAG